MKSTVCNSIFCMDPTTRPVHRSWSSTKFLCLMNSSTTLISDDFLFPWFFELGRAFIKLISAQDELKSGESRKMDQTQRSGAATTAATVSSRTYQFHPARAAIVELFNLYLGVIYHLLYFMGFFFLDFFSSYSTELYWIISMLFSREVGAKSPTIPSENRR